MRRSTIGIFTWSLIATLGLVFAVAAVAAPRASAAGVPYAVGDVFAGQSGDVIKHFSSTGVLLDTLHTTFSTETGMCFGEMGRLRSTNFASNNMTMFDNMGNVIPPNPWRSGLSDHPESCVLDASGAIYVGTADGLKDIYKLDTSGALLAQYNPTTGPRGTDWIDLAADQCTMYYSSEGPTIRRFDVCASTQGTNFATNFTASGGATDCYALRIRTNGEVLIACHDRVYRLDAAGSVIQTYLASAYGSSFLFALNLDPDGTTFWTADIVTGRIHRIDITTGTQVTTFVAGGGGVFGLAIFGEITAARPPASLVLTPATATNPVGTQHCVTATVRDATGQPLQGVTVVFSVTGTAGNSASGSVDTDANGEAVFCYIGPTMVGIDTITAFADSNKNGTQDPGEPSGIATKEWVAGPPATLTLSPKAATNPVDTQHCVTATVKDSFGNPVKGVVVQFTVTGSVNTSGSATTDKNGQATFCYQGPALPGADVIRAFADTNGNGRQDPGEPFDEATKAWVLPVSTPGCEIKITNGGWIIASNGDRANFGGNAMADGSGNASGVEEYQDKGPAQPFNLHGDVLVVVCGTETPSPKSGTIFGNATIDGAGSHIFRIDVVDNQEPGAGFDHYRMRVESYDSGDQVLMGGNIQVHKS